LTGATTLTAAPTLSALTASLPVVTNASKGLASATVTGTGTTVVMSASPTLSGTVGGALTWSASQTFSSRIGIGGAPFADINTYIQGTTVGSASTTWGVVVEPVFPATSTAGIVDIEADLWTIASAWTAASGTVLHIKDANKGAGSAITTQYGIRIDNLAAGGTNYAIKTGTGKVDLGDSLIGISQRLTGSLTADTIISGKFYAEGTFTAAATGFSACSVGSLSGSTCTATASWVRVGKMVSVKIPNITGTSNSTSLTITGWSAAIQPPSQTVAAMVAINDNGSSYAGELSLSGGTATLFIKTAASSITGTFTNSGTKGFDPITITYTRQ
jgi:hypothetical protein